MKPLGSNFVTRTGLIVLVVMTLIAAYLKLTSLEVLLVATLILCLIAYLWSRFSLDKLRVTIADEDCRAFPGETLSAEATLKNEKFLPVIWLKATFPTGGADCIAALNESGEPAQPDENGEKAEICEHFLWIMPQQSITWSQKAVAVHRGVCKLSAMSVSSGDGFGLACRDALTTLPTGFRFIVYPRVTPVSTSVILNHMSEMEQSPQGFYKDMTLINSIRDYHDGDSVKDINWRLMARQGTVQVNVHERLARRRVCLIPDLESFLHIKVEDTPSGRETCRLVYKEDMEHMFSLIASAIVSLSERKVLCSLVIPAIGSAPARIVVPENGEMQVMQLLTVLAEVSYNGEETSYPAEDMTASCHMLGQFFLFSREATANRCDLSERLDGLTVFTVVQHGGDSGGSRYIIDETELTAI